MAVKPLPELVPKKIEAFILVAAETTETQKARFVGSKFKAEATNPLGKHIPIEVLGIAIVLEGADKIIRVNTAVRVAAICDGVSSHRFPLRGEAISTLPRPA
jgi:hypothetical protein